MPKLWFKVVGMILSSVTAMQIFNFNEVVRVTLGGNFWTGCGQDESWILSHSPLKHYPLDPNIAFSHLYLCPYYAHLHREAKICEHPQMLLTLCGNLEVQISKKHCWVFLPNLWHAFENEEVIFNYNWHFFPPGCPSEGIYLAGKVVPLIMLPQWELGGGSCEQAFRELQKASVRLQSLKPGNLIFPVLLGVSD